MIDNAYVSVLRLGLHTLNAKLIAVLALLMTFALAVYAMIDPNLWRVILVAYFGTLICLPAIVFARARQVQEAQNANTQ